MTDDRVLKLCECLPVPYLFCRWYLSVLQNIILMWEWISTWTCRISSGVLLNDATKIGFFFPFFFPSFFFSHGAPGGLSSIDVINSWGRKMAPQGLLL